MERWKTQTREERLQDAWENRNKFEIRLTRRTSSCEYSNEYDVVFDGYFCGGGISG